MQHLQAAVHTQSIAHAHTLAGLGDVVCQDIVERNVRMDGNTHRQAIVCNFAHYTILWMVMIVEMLCRLSTTHL